MRSLGNVLRRHRVIVPVAVVALVIAAMGGVLTAQAGRHSHSVRMVYVKRDKTLAGNDINFVLAFCPSGTKVTGFGADTSGTGVGVILQQDLDPPSHSGGAIFENISSSSATMHGKAACVKNRTGTSSGKVSTADRAKVASDLRHKVSKLQTALSR